MCGRESDSLDNAIVHCAVCMCVWVWDESEGGETTWKEKGGRQRRRGSHSLRSVSRSGRIAWSTHHYSPEFSPYTTWLKNIICSSF